MPLSGFVSQAAAFAAEGEAMSMQGNGKKIPLNVYLLKENNGILWDDKEVIASPLSGGKPQKIPTEKHLLGPDGVYGTLFIRKPILETSPDWLAFIAQGLSEKVSTKHLTNKSVSALLIVTHNSRQFAITFGHGRHMIESRLIEDRFGIKVVLNSVSPDRIASIDRQTFDASPRISRTQTIKASSVSDYMINAEQDLLKGLVGFTKLEYSDALGPLIAGIDSFKASVPAELAEINKFLTTILERSISKDYLSRTPDGNNSEFSWVENLLPVKNKDMIDELDNQLWISLKTPEKNNMWLAVPDIVDWSNVAGFSYRSEVDSTDIHEILYLEKFLATLRSDATLETIKRRDIYMIHTDGRAPVKFSAFKCIYAEIKHKTKLFILHAGSWFGVESSFQTTVELYYANIDKKKFTAPFVEYDHSGEGEYNEYVCAKEPSDYAMLDRQLIRFGGNYDKIEVCDIYKKLEGEHRGEFIHVKRGRGSSNLSHLFAQGLVASTLLVREPNFVKSVNIQLAKQGFTALPEKFEAKGNDIVYAIIDGDGSSSLDIPFFSKVTLQNCGKTIASYGYGVKLLHIPESAAHRAKAALKAATKAAKIKATSIKPNAKKSTMRKSTAKPSTGNKKNNKAPSKSNPNPN